MEREFQRRILPIRRRARLIQGIERAWPPAAVALLLTLGYQAARLPGPTGEVKLHWLILADLTIALVGFLWGYLGRVDLARVLFQADRRLGLHERLSSLHALYRDRGRAEFIPILSRRLPPRIDPAQAVPLPRRERGGLLLLATLAILTLFLAMPQRTIPFYHRPITGEQAPAKGREEFSRLPQGLAALEERLTRLQEDFSRLEERQPEGLPAGRRSGELQALQEGLKELQGELWGPMATSAATEAQEELSELLSAMEEGLQRGQRPSPQLQEELDRLSSRLQGGALKELLQQLTREDQVQILQNIPRIEALTQGVAEAGERLEEHQRPPDQPAEAAPGEGEGEGEAQAPGGKGEGKQPPEEGLPGTGGEEPGTTPGERIAGEPSAMTMPSETREFHIPGKLGELGAVERLITKGTPLEMKARDAEGRPSLQVSFQKVIAMLETRELPDDLQEVVKRYFLLITEE